MQNQGLHRQDVALEVHEGDLVDLDIHKVDRSLLVQNNQISGQIIQTMTGYREICWIPDIEYSKNRMSQIWQKSISGHRISSPTLISSTTPVVNYIFHLSSCTWLDIYFKNLKKSKMQVPDDINYCYENQNSKLMLLRVGIPMSKIRRYNSDLAHNVYYICIIQCNYLITNSYIHI